MAKIKYEDIALRTKAVDTVNKANLIIEEYATQGYSLTLRQLYYQFVSRGFCPNTNREYQRLSWVISSGRRAGLIDWDAIVDRTRFLRSWGRTFATAGEAIGAAAKSFRVDLWQDQAAYVEVWFEKDALLGVFERAGAARRLPLMSCRGYGSDSTWWEAAQRIGQAAQELGKKCIVLHFGDHDPSGIDMTRDVEARLNLFGAYPKVKRLALNMDQVRKYNPPPNPAKESDSRFADYKSKFGDESWELDALSPDMLVKLVDREVAKVIDLPAWDEALDREFIGKRQLEWVSNKWDRISKRIK